MAISQQQANAVSDFNNITRGVSYLDTLTYAVFWNQVQDIEHVLSVCKVNVDLKDDYQRTSLHTAAYLNQADSHFSTIKTLLENGADVNAQDKEGNTPLHYLVKRADVKTTKLLLDSKANIQIKNLKFENPLFEAVSEANVKVVRLLLGHGSYIESSDFEGRTPLHKAAHANFRNSHFEVAESLLKHGADVNAQDKDGRTALHHLVMVKKPLAGVKIVELFLNFNADVSIKDNSNETPVVKAIIAGNPEVLRLFLDHGADVSSVYSRNGSTLLHCACKPNFDFKSHAIIKCLLKKGANVNAMDSKGQTPLMYLMKIEDLRQQWENVRITLNYLPKFKFLLKYSDVGMTDFEDNTVFCYDKSKIFWKIVLEHVAKVQALGFPVQPVLMNKILSVAGYKNYFKKCEKELEMAKSTKLRNSWVSFFNLLVDSKRKLKNYAGNRDLIESFKSSKCTTKFPIYGFKMLKNVKKGLESRVLFDKSSIVLSYYLPICNPDHLIIRNILDCLTWKDYVTLQ